MKLCRCLIAACAIVALHTSCVDNAARSVVMCDVDSRAWAETVNAYYENDDTLSQRKLSLALRFNNDFSCDTLPLMVRVSLPDGRYAKEHVDFVVNRPYRATAARMTATLPYREHSLLGMSGCYIFSLTPAKEICGVESVGVIIEQE